MTREDEDRALNGILHRELGGVDHPLNWRGEQSEPPTPERIARLGKEAKIARVAKFLAAPHAIVPQIEQLARPTERKDGKIEKPAVSPSMKQAAQWYAVLAFVADGPSVGVGRYGTSNGGGSPPWGKSITSDERMMARKIFDAARLAAFGVKDRTGRWVCDEAARLALEPVLLGDDQAWSMARVGAFLGSYEQTKSASSTAGKQEVVQVARRLRLFFGLPEDG